MEKTLELKLNAPRLLRFVAEGHHTKTSRPYSDPLCSVGEAPSNKPIVGVFGYGYTVSYKWLSQANGVGSPRAPLVSCPCTAGI